MGWMAHRKWKEIKQQPGTAGPGNMLGTCLVSFHFLWAILCPQAVVVVCVCACQEGQNGRSKLRRWRRSHCDRTIYSGLPRKPSNKGKGKNEREQQGDAQMGMGVQRVASILSKDTCNGDANRACALWYSKHSLPMHGVVQLNFTPEIKVKYGAKFLGQLCDSRTSYISSVTISASANNFLS